jgi:deoxyhypusine monooxygenase
LFKHEIAFVLGELGTDALPGVPYLKAAVENTENHAMVRHEAAESIGGICNTETEFLTLYKSDPDVIVAQS